MSQRRNALLTRYCKARGVGRGLAVSGRRPYSFSKVVLPKRTNKVKLRRQKKATVRQASPVIVGRTVVVLPPVPVPKPQPPKPKVQPRELRGGIGETIYIYE